MGIMGRSSDALDFVEGDECLTVRDAIFGLCEKYGKKFEEIALIEGGSGINPGLIVFLNGQHISDPSSCRLVFAGEEEDEVQLMIASQMKGGSR